MSPYYSDSAKKKQSKATLVASFWTDRITVNNSNIDTERENG